MARKKIEREPGETVKIRLEPQEMDALWALLKPYSHIEGLSTLARWFIRQDSFVRQGVLGLLPPGFERRLAEAVLHSLGEDQDRPKSATAEAVEAIATRPEEPNRQSPSRSAAPQRRAGGQ